MSPRSPFLVAFREPSFSSFFAGQVASNIGTWFQNLALSLVLLEVTGQAQSLSAVTVAQFGPILLLAIPAGRLADRVSPRLILLVAAGCSATIVLALSIAIADVERNLVLVYGLIALLGSVNAFERVAAQALIHTLVDRSILGRAVASYTMVLSVARSIGPGLAGIAFASLGGAACLQINAASYLLVLVSLLLVRPRHRPARTVVDPLRGRDLWGNRWFVTVLLTNAVIALLALNLLIVLTSLVTITFDGDATAVGAVHTLNAVGGILGGLLASAQRAYGPRLLAIGCLCFSLALAANALAPSLLVVLVLAPVLGAAHGLYQGTVYAAAQSAVPPALIGRAMALVTLGQFGVTSVGAVIVGLVIDASSAGVALTVGAVAAAGAAVLVLARSRRGASPPRPPSDDDAGAR